MKIWSFAFLFSLMAATASPLPAWLSLKFISYQSPDLLMQVEGVGGNFWSGWTLNRLQVQTPSGYWDFARLRWRWSPFSDWKDFYSEEVHWKAHEYTPAVAVFKNVEIPSLKWQGTQPEIPTFRGSLTFPWANSNFHQELHGEQRPEGFLVSFDQGHKEILFHGSTAEWNFQDWNLTAAFESQFPLVLESSKDSFTLPEKTYFADFLQKEKLEFFLKNSKWRVGETHFSWSEGTSRWSNTDDDFKERFEVKSSGSGLWGLTANEYRQRASPWTFDRALSQMIWKKEPGSLTDSNKSLLKNWKEAFVFRAGPQLPSIALPLQADRTLKTEFFGNLGSHINQDVSNEVLYFASLRDVYENNCAHAKPWLGQLTSRDSEPLVQGKVFALLAECERNPSRRHQLIETASTYAPHDTLIREMKLMWATGHREPATKSLTRKTKIKRKNLKVKRGKTDKAH